MKTTQIPLIAMALLLVGCAAPPMSTTNGDQGQAQVTTDVVKRQDLTGYRFFDGKLVVPQSAQQTAFSPYDAPVEAVLTSAGKYVQRGQPIVRLTITGSESATSAAKSGVNAAEADYSNQKANSAAPVRDAQRYVSEARAAERAARSTVANGGEADVEGATRDRMDAEAALRQYQAEQRRTLQPSRDAVGQAADSLSDARASAAKGIVRSAISGTVVTLEAKPGMDAKAKQPLATIVNFDAARVQGLVPAELKDLVAKGSRVIVLMGGHSSDPVDGTVVDVSVVPPSEGQQGQGYLAVIRFVKPRALVQPSLSVRRVGIKTGTVKDALVIPVGAIFTREGKTTVKVRNGQQWVETTVVTGVSDGALTEVKSGLEAGAVLQVITRPEAAPKA